MSMSHLTIIKNGLRTWFQKPTRMDLQISVDDPLIIKYRMTLGTLYYDSRKQDIIVNLPKDPQIHSLSLIMEFLRNYHPGILNLWQAVKRDTGQHLNYVARAWMKYLLQEVDNIISLLKARYPSLASYDGSPTQENFYVRDNIIEGLYKEIEHIALTGNEIGLFQFEPSLRKVGNAFLFVKSSNEELLTQFMALINKALHNENLITGFRNAEIESKVLDFKQGLHDITIHLP